MVFQKPFSELKTSAPIRNSDRRKLKTRVAEQYNLLDSAQVDALVPDGLQMARFVTSGGEHGTLYTASAALSNQPLWFSLGRSGDREAEDLIPTLYTLSKAPKLLPTIQTPEAVLPFLMGGADLMIPGVHTQRTVLDPLQTSTIVSIRGIAVGRLALPGKDIQPGKKGKAVIVSHIIGDVIYNMGTKMHQSEEAPGETPDNFDAQDVSQADGATRVTEAVEGLSLDDTNTATTGSSQAGSSQLSQTAPTQPGLSPQEVDGLLRTGLLLAISSFPRTALPISTSNFYSSHILPSRPAYPTLSSPTPVDIKHSSFKSLTTFLKAAEKDGLLTIKAKGDSITMLNSGHPDLAALGSAKIKTVAEMEAKAKKREADEKAKEGETRSVEVIELWKPHGPTIALFEDAGADTSALYNAIDLRATFSGYIAAKHLQNVNEPQYLNVAPDSPLHDALDDKKDHVPEHCKRDDAFKRLQRNMQAWHSISGTVRKGSLSPVSVVARMRQGKRPVTLLTNFEPFGLDAQMLADELRPLCAGSTSVNPLPGKNAGKEVMIQGKQIKNVVDVILAKGIQKKWIETEDLTEKK